MKIRIEPPYRSVEILIVALLIFCTTLGFFHLGVQAVDKEMAFNENVRMARCVNHGDWRENLPWCHSRLSAKLERK